MRKSFIVLGLVFTTAFSYASNDGISVHGLRGNGKHFFNPGIFNKNKLININKTPGRFACSVTLTASVGYSATYISASCSSTKSTCDAAIAEASGCVKSALASAKKAIK